MTHQQNADCNGFIEYCITDSVERKSDMFIKTVLMGTVLSINYCLFGCWKMDFLLIVISMKLLSFYCIQSLYFSLRSVRLYRVSLILYFL